jgi:hypothetical protein
MQRLSNAFLNGLFLPLRIYLKPTEFRNYVNTLAPELLPDYSLLEAVGDLRNPVTRAGLLSLSIQYLVAFIWVPVVLLITYALMPNAEWEHMRTGQGTSILFGMALMFVLSLQGSVTSGIAIGVSFGIIFSIVSGINSAYLSSEAARLNLSIAVVVDQGRPSIWSYLNWCIGFGIIASIMCSVFFSVKTTVLFGLVSAVAIFVLLVANVDAPGAPSLLVAGIAFALVTTHLILLPFQLVIVSITWVLLPSFPQYVHWYWWFSPLRWDEFVCVPLPGTVELLTQLYRKSARQGERALDEVFRNRFQRVAAEKARTQLLKEVA